MFNNNGKSSLANKTIQVVIDGAAELISSTDAMTAKLEMYQNRLKNLPKGNKYIKQINKEIEKLTNQMVDAVMYSDEFIDAIEEMGRQGKISKQEADGLVKMLGSLSTEQLKVAKTAEETIDKQKRLQKVWKDTPSSVLSDMKQLRMDIRETGAEFAKTFIEGSNEGLSMAEKVGDAWNDAADTVFQFGGKYGYAIGLAMKVLTPYVKKMFELTDAQKAANGVTAKTVKLYAAEKAELDLLFNSLNDVNTSQSDRSKAITTINSKYGAYLPNLLNEKSSAEDLAEAYKEVNKQLLIRVINRAVQDERIKVATKSNEKLAKSLDKVREIRAKIDALGTVKGGTKEYKQKVLLMMELRKEEVIRQKILDDLAKENAAINQRAEELRKVYDIQGKEGPKTLKQGNKNNEIIKKGNELLKERIELLKKAVDAAKTSVDDLEKEVESFNTKKELDKAIEESNKKIAKAEKEIAKYKAEASGSDNKANKAAKERLDLAQKELDTRKQIHDAVILQAGAERDAETKLYNERMAMLGKAQKEFESKGGNYLPYDLNHVLDQNPQLVKQLGDMGKDQYDVVAELKKALKGESIAITEAGTGKYRAYGEKGDPETLLLAAIRTFVENNGNIYAGKLYAASGGKVQTTSSVTAAKTMAEDVYMRTIRESSINVEKAQAAFDKAQEEYNKLGGVKNKEAEAAMNEAEAKLAELKKRQADLEFRRAEVIAEQTAEEAKYQAQLAGDTESQKIVEERYKTFRNYLDALNIQYQNEIDATAEEIRNSDNAKKLASLLGITVEELVTADGGLGVVDFDEEDLRKMGASEETIKFFDAFSKSVEMRYDNLYEENLNRIRSSAKNFIKELRAALPEEMRKSIDETRIAAESARLHYETTTAGLYRVNADGSRTEMTSTDVLAHIQEINTQMDKASGKKLKELTGERDVLASMVLDLLKDAQRLEMKALQRSTVDIIQEIRNRAGEDGWSEAKIAEETELAMRDAMNKVKDLELRQSKELESLQSTLDGKKGEGFSWKIVETKIKDSSTQILGIADTVFNTIGSVRDYFIQALNDSIDALTTKMDALESESDRIASKISELEDDLVGKRSGRRDAILQALEQERLKEEEVAKAKIGLAEELAKKEKELADQERARAKEQLYMDLARAISNVALGITNALASSGLLGIIQGVAIGAAGAVQTGIIAKQIGAFAEGGYTGNGEGPRDSTGYKQAGVVHEGEWVAPKWMVNSPSFGSVIQSLEASRQRGFADGGMVSADYNGMSNAVNNNTTMQRQMNMLMGAAMDMANRPTYVSVTDINNVNMKQAKRVKASRIGG